MCVHHIHNVVCLILKSELQIVVYCCRASVRIKLESSSIIVFTSFLCFFKALKALLFCVMCVKTVKKCVVLCVSEAERAGGDLWGLVQGHQTPAGSPSLAAPP